MGDLLFTKCTNLNTEHCQYTKSPEDLLSLFGDPENFPISDQKTKELNDQCSGCNWFREKLQRY